MASYYTQFAAKIDGLTSEEGAWLIEQLELDRRNFDDSEVEDSCDLDFEWEFVGDSLHLWNMEGTEECLDQIPVLVQEFLAKFRPLDSWSMSFRRPAASR